MTRLGTSHYLGGCSYKSKRDFIDTSMYYTDMRSEACTGLADDLIASANAFLALLPRRYPKKTKRRAKRGVKGSR